MNFWSCVLVLFGLAFLITGISMKLRKKAKKDDENKLVQENVQSPDESLSADIPKVSYGPIHIFFGSQTGTAAGYAKLLGEEGEKNGFEPKVIDLIDFDPKQLQSIKLAIFLMATHGEGEPTDNSKEFNKWFCDSERTGDELKKLNFAVFGLGNKQYQFYNAQGKKTNQYVEKLGGKRVYKYGEGDDNESLEDDFNEWKTNLWDELKKVVEIIPMTDRGNHENHKPKTNLPFILTITKDDEVDLDSCKDDKPYDFQMKQYLASANAQVTLIKEIRQKTDDGSTLHIEIDTGSVGLKYRTADNMTIFPENSSDTVERVAKMLGLNLDDVFTLEENIDLDKNIKFKYPFPTPISIRTYLTKFCDLVSPVRKKQLKELAEFCSKAEDKEKLVFLSSPSGKIEFEALIHTRMWGLIEIIEHFNVRPGLTNLIQISSLIQPRYYTIASSSRRNPDTIHLCFTMQQDILPDGNRRLGLTSTFCTHLFHQQNQGKKLPRVRVSVKESSFQLPADPTAPVYMVGPGAGIAPFKGFIEEKDFCKQQGENIPFGEMSLYFGCRGRNWDYLYKEELLKYFEEKIVENLYVAFSRDNPQKVYVQNLLDLNQQLVIRDVFERNATFYICGAMGMGKDVVQRLTNFAAIYYKISVEEAARKIEEMEKNKVIIKELWG